MLSQNDVINVLDETIQEYFEKPIDLLNNGSGAKGESEYIIRSKPSYIRTLQDVAKYIEKNLCLRNEPSEINILEMGAFLGVTSISLAKAGFSVTAMDIPEFMTNERLQLRYKRHHIKMLSQNLKTNRIPCEDDKYDVVMLCEVLEHLNFNPLPIIVEINRTLKSGGLLYLSLPNIARLTNRLKLLLGHSIHNPIDDFFAQLNGKDNMVVGLHWREYTANEIKYMFEKLGFLTLESYITSDTDFLINSSLRNAAKKVIYRVMPSLGFHQVHLFRKIKQPHVNFQFCDATQSK
ncbi:MAG: class I SAM-dependent methyltransferase [Deltaproteobacteria bacterium HGW-Deltaproteobacteria-6]|jgi:SAM-dependent methyltransferase|nr:MAG: class I SAM-dependent methyltransferase [Deltaproteobacteria bacterium HGW-Deltaproteobacteria-6]